MEPAFNGSLAEAKALLLAGVRKDMVTLFELFRKGYTIDEEHVQTYLLLHIVDLLQSIDSHLESMGNNR